MKQEITNITVFFYGTKKGKRKVALQSERVFQLTGHVLLSPDDLNGYERAAWSMIDSMGYKNAVKGNLTVNHGSEDNESGMVMIQLLPKQSQLIAR